MLQVLPVISTFNLADFAFIFPIIDFPTMFILLVISLITNGFVWLIVGCTKMKTHLLQAKAHAVAYEQ
jgi:hypothetical protein